MRWKISFITVSVALLAILGTGCNKLKARDHLNRGIADYKNARYPEAVENFKTAVELDPDFTTSRLYLATAYMIQYIPGAESPENMQMAKAAHDTFSKVLEQDPSNEVAIASIASLYFNQKKLDEAREWNQKLISYHPNNKEAYYTLGVIAWTKTFQKRMEARAKLGMKPEDPGPLKDKKVREEVADDAMAYLNLLHRERADLQESADAYKKDIEVADSWVQKTLETKKIKQARQEKHTGGITAAQ
jgi:tetratricopeptide (TPR) repeat protein